MESVAIERRDGIALVRLQRPPANALDPELLAAGDAAAKQLAAERPAAVVITGSGGFFSAGVDLKLAPTLSGAEQGAIVGAINRLFYSWYSLDLPVVAAVTGHAVAGGMILALCGDHRVGSLAGRYGLTELRVGAPYPAAALAVVRAELAPATARRLVLGGELVDADAALELGLVDELAEPTACVDAATDVARRLAALPPATYETVKAQLRAPASRRCARRSSTTRSPTAGSATRPPTPPPRCSTGAAGPGSGGDPVVGRG